jgi:hypothetical protein
VHTLKLCGITYLLLIAVQSPAVGDWTLNRNTGNGACSVQPPDMIPHLGTLLASHPTRKETCQDAQSRKTDDFGDSNKCPTYTTGTVSECKKDGIDLVE